ncbi:MAG TPA: hypothetical protein VFN55_07690 [Solirubrobacteraceae bacterium]|nr:hypothetical protein [Solirubrobacteraceae bacterium]
MDRSVCSRGPIARRLAVIAVAVLAGGCGSDRAGPLPPSRPPGAGLPARLLREARPIGSGARFHPPARGPVPGACRHRLGRRQAAHVELFAADRVVVLAAGIGVRGPVTRSAGRIVGARCFGTLATLEPTGVVIMRPAAALTLAALFRAWGQPLRSDRVAGFVTTPRRPVRVYVDGRRVNGPPGAVRLRRHGEVVIETGPYVPPHARYTFPPGL